MKRASPFLVVWCVLLLAASACFAQTFITFDPPDSTSTFPQAINPKGQIAGYYGNATDNHTYGFLREPDGTFTTFAAPTHDVFGATFVTDMNQSGEITGYVVRGSFFFVLGFLRRADGTFVLWGDEYWGPFAAPASIITLPCFDGVPGTAINAVGQIVIAGPYCFTAYLREPDGTFLNFDLGYGPGSWLRPRAIDPKGQITGFYVPGAGDLHQYGFLRQPDGTFTAFDPPNSTATFAEAINPKGQIAGYYQDASFVVLHGFLREPDGTFTAFDPAGSVSTQPTAITLKGEITGFYASADGIYHGFLRHHNGTIVSFDVPGGNAGTFPQGINPKGEIVGYYQDTNFVLHGFVRSAR
jgi:hypothetical protein